MDSLVVDPLDEAHWQDIIKRLSDMLSSALNDGSHIVIQPRPTAMVAPGSQDDGTVLELDIELIVGPRTPDFDWTYAAIDIFMGDLLHELQMCNLICAAESVTVLLRYDGGTVYMTYPGDAETIIGATPSIFVTSMSMPGRS